MKRPPALPERPLRAASSMNPGAGAGRTALVKPEPGTPVRLETATGGGGSLSEIELGPVVLATALAPDPTDFTWSTVTVAKRALVWRFYVSTSSTIQWSVRVTSEPDGAGELMFEAVGIGDTIYQCSWPWLFENHVGGSGFYVGVRNHNGLPSDFTLATLRAVALG